MILRYQNWLKGLSVMRKTTFILVCFAFVFCLFTACKAGKPLTVWVSSQTFLEGESQEIVAHLATFQLQREDEGFTADITVFQEALDESQEVEGYAMTQSLVNSLLAGEGPDVILFTDYDFGDVRKLAENGVFLDLTEFLENSEVITEADFVPGVFTSCKFKGAYWYFPLSYTVLGNNTTKKILSDRGWAAAENVSDLLEQISEFCATSESDTTFFYPGVDTEENNLSLRWLVEYSGIQLIDYDTGKILPDEEELYRILSTYKPIWRAQLDAEGYSYGGLYSEALMREDELNFLYPSLLTTIYNYSQLNQDVPMDMQCIGGLDGTITATVNTYVAINANSRSPEEAWRFVETLLGQPVQTEILERFEITMEIPVRMGCLENYWSAWDAFCSQNSCHDSSGQVHYYSELDEESVKRFTERCESAAVHYNSQTALDLLMETMRPYLADETEFPTCLEKLRNQLILYAGE